MQENKQEKSPIKQRILLFLAYKGVSPYEFYKNSGVTRGVLAQNNGISEDNLSRFISYFPTINLVWLMSGQGDMELANQESGGIIEKQESMQEISHNSSNTSIVGELVATIKNQAEEIGRLKERNEQLERENMDLRAISNRNITPQDVERVFAEPDSVQKV